MNIEEANDNLIMLKYFLQEEGDENWEKYCESIETLLTAYEKEKEKIRKMLQELEDRRNKQPVIGYWSKKAMLEKLLKEE